MRHQKLYQTPGTQRALVLQVAITLTEMFGEFTPSDLAVSCWTLEKMWFGLRGYEQLYPDTTRVYPRLVELVRICYIVRTVTNGYKAVIK